MSDLNTELFCLTCEEEEEIRSYLPHFLFYRQLDKTTDCYCTACHSRQDIERKKFKHNDPGTCPFCGSTVQFKAMFRGRKSYRHRQNFAVFRRADENKVIIRCMTAFQNFPEEDLLEPDFDWEEKCVYILEPGAAAKYSLRWIFHADKGGKWTQDWVRQVSQPTEPTFNCNSFGYTADNSYTLIGDGCLSNTFLKYFVSGLPEQIGCRFVTYLCRASVHPNIEYLVKGGFFDLAMRYVGGNAGVRINWKSNNLLKMLRINRTELEFLRDKDNYKRYTDFRRNVFNGRLPDETIKYFERFDSSQDIVCDIVCKTGISSKQVMDYIEKQQSSEGIYFTAHAYDDYLEECRKLDYDLSDRSVAMPRKLWAAHQRTMQIIKFRADELARKQLEKSNELRGGLAYVNEKKGLQVIVPKSVEEIVYEGKALSHCVGGYAQRHVEGKLHILFLRKLSEPDTPYYTMEVNTSGKIVQCRGYKNNVVYNGGQPKPQEITDFEKEYQAYLDKLKTKKARKTA